MSRTYLVPIWTMAALLGAWGVPANASLVGYYTFDSGAVATIGNDSSGQGNHLTAFGGVLVDSSGRFGSAMALNGTTGVLAIDNSGVPNESAVPTGFPTGSSPYTISVWIDTSTWVNGFSANEGMIGWGGYGAGGQVNAFRLQNANQAVNYWWGRDLTATVGNVANGSWHNLIVTYDGVTRSIWVDGVRVGSDALAAPNVTAQNFRIGRTYGNEFFQGSMDDVAVWNNGLTAAQIKALAAGTSTPLGLSAGVARSWIGGASDWTTAANWSGSTLPTALDDANVVNGGTALVTTASPVAGVLTVGGTGAGAVQLSSGGTLTATTLNVATNGRLILAGGTLACSDIHFAGGTLQAATAFSSSQAMILDAGGMTVDTNGFNPTLSGLSGAGGLTKTGLGTLTLTGTNAYNGGTTLAVGTLSAGSYASLGTAGLTFTGGTLQFASGSAFDISARTVTLGAGGGTIDTNGNNVTLASSIGNGGAGGLTKTGAGTLTLSGAATYTGSTNVSQGTLAFAGSGTAYNGGATAGNIAVNNGGTLRFDRQDTFGNHTATPAVAVTINAGGTVASNGYFTTLNNLTLSGGTLRSNGGNNTTWGSFALKGTVTVNGSTPSYITTGTGANNYIFVGTNAAGGATTFNVADVTGDAQPDLVVSTTLSNNRDGAGLPVASGLVKTGAGTMALLGNHTYTGPTTISQGTLQLHNSLVARYTFDDSGNLGNDSSGLSNHLKTGAGAPASYGSGVSGGALSLNASSLVPVGSFPAGVPVGGNAYTTAAWINPTGGGGWIGWGNYAGSQVNALRMAGSTSVLNYWYSNDLSTPAGSDLIAGDPPNGGWHYVVATYDPSLAANQHKIYIDGVLVAQRTASGLNVQTANFTLGVTNFTEYFNGYLDDVAIFNRALSAAEINTLMTTGNAAVAASDVLPTGTAVQIASGAALDLGGVQQTIASLADYGSGGGLVTNSAARAPVTLTVNPAGGSTTFSGAIADGAGGISLTKTGAGTQVLGGTNTYTGPTTVAGGTLVINGSVTSPVTVSGGTLGGTGTIVGDVVIGSLSGAGGTHAPGTSPGVQTIEGNYTIYSNGLLAIEALGDAPGDGSTGYDQVLIQGADADVSLDGTLAVAFGGSGWATVGDQLWIIRNDTGGDLTGTFSNAADGTVVANFAGINWQVFYNADYATGALSGGNDVLLAAVPEPSTLLLAGLGLLWLGLFRGRRSAAVR
jgi:fibronectin-binding autotransporter adhesin